MQVQIFGIRHHGPGSARSLRQALDALGPDVVLVEGPPDAEEVLPLLIHSQMRPPVSLLIYAVDAPSLAVYYPFAVFSPEWQALSYALTHGIPARFMDLPQRFQLAARLQLAEAAQEAAGPTQLAAASDSATELPADPIGALAEAAGYSDSERWWEHMVEQRRDSSGLFAAILEAMSALRATAPPPDPYEARREAWMRQSIRQAEQAGFQRIAVVCGAWHAPALQDLHDAEADRRLLHGMPTIALRATWVPWTYSRLSYQSGYGAGIESPGWFEHLWQSSAAAQPPAEVAVRWMTKIARLLRSEDLDASSAHVIEAVRLAEALAALRSRPLPGLPELSEAAQAVFCFNSDLPMQLIHKRLIVSERLGEVPDETPLAPLQQDLARAQRRLRLPAEAEPREYDLDLRKPNDLARSHLLHRLNLLGIEWGQVQHVSGARGTFHELWRLHWQPELAIGLIEAGVWGNTIADAAAARSSAAADAASDLPTLTRLVDQALLADLPDTVAYLMQRVDAEAAVASDIAHLLGALPALVNVLRYGNVRKTDTSALAHVVDGLLVRSAVGLAVACSGINDDAASALFPLLVQADQAINLLQDAELLALWRSALRRVADSGDAHGLIAGRATRLLLDAGELAVSEAARRLSLALSAASDPAQAASWIEGLIQGSGSLLVHDDALWPVIDGWLRELSAERFVQVLPLLRRTFASFSAAERRGLGERAKRAAARAGTATQTGAPDQDVDLARAYAAVATVSEILGLTHE